MEAHPVKWNISVAGGKENNENLKLLRWIVIKTIRYARSNFEFSHSLSSGERNGNSLNQFL